MEHQYIFQAIFPNASCFMFDLALHLQSTTNNFKGNKDQLCTSRMRRSDCRCKRAIFSCSGRCEGIKPNWSSSKGLNAKVRCSCDSSRIRCERNNHETACILFTVILCTNFPILKNHFIKLQKKKTTDKERQRKLPKDIDSYVNKERVT